MPATSEAADRARRQAAKKAAAAYRSACGAHRHVQRRYDATPDPRAQACAQDIMRALRAAADTAQ